MSKKRDRRRQFQDLDVYEGCPTDAGLGILPLGVGWLRHDVAFMKGDVEKFPDGFLERLLIFCETDFGVCETPGQRTCPICRHKIPPYGSAEIRVLSKSDIYAAPDLIHHYITAHQYRPPDEFVQATLDSPLPTSVEHRALQKFYQI